MKSRAERIDEANEPRPGDFAGKGEEWLVQLHSREQLYAVPDKVWRPDEGTVPGPSRPTSSSPPRPSSSSPPRRTSWTADELLAAEFPPARWAVEGIIAEGLTVLAGPPKVGKSWMALGLAVAVASGGKALGRVDVEPGDVLYLGLEDTPRRLQCRLRKVLARSAAPARLTVATACPPLGAGGQERITAWLGAHPSARLVVVDVFARIRGRADRQVSAYEADYTAMAAVKTIADTYGAAVLVLHHTRKAAAEDFLDTVSGTQGIAGAADATLVLARSRGTADATLQVTGRDVEETEFALKFAPDLGSWQLLDGPAIEHTLGETRRRILHLVREAGALTPSGIADRLDIEVTTAKSTAWRMARDGQLDTADGYYTVAADPLQPATGATVQPATDPAGCSAGCSATHPATPIGAGQSVDGCTVARVAAIEEQP